DDYANAAGDSDTTDSRDIGIALITSRADTDGVSFSCYPNVTDNNVVTAGGEVEPCGRTEADVVVAGGIVYGLISVRGVGAGGRVAIERILTIGGVATAGGVKVERIPTVGRVKVTECIAIERRSTVGRVVTAGGVFV